MSDDWNTVLKIGSKVGGGGGGGPRETTIKSKSQLNAAQRAGNILGTEKKYGTANSGGSGGGQRLTMVDRADGPVKQNLVPKSIGEAMIQARNTKLPKAWTHADLAAKSSLSVNDVKKWESGDIPFNEKQFNQLESALGVYLRGVNRGQPRPAKKLPKWKQKELEAQKKAAEEKK